MLDPRYADDARPLLHLSAAQQRAKRAVEEKVARGVYAFEHVPCAVCQGDRFRTLAQKDRCGLPTPVVVCRDCGLVQTNPRMTADAYRDYYNSAYRVLHDRESTPAQAFARERRRGRGIHAFLAQRGVLQRRPDRPLVVEVGCGAGGILAAFREAGCDVLGVDLAKDRLDYGRTEHGLDLVAGALADVRLDRAIDLVVYSHALEHVLDLDAELTRLSHVLAEDGLVHVEVPGIKRLEATYEDDLLRYLQNAHVSHFSLTTLTNLMEKHAYALVVGDEAVRAVFRRADSARTDWTNDYPAVVASLERAEQRRRTSIRPKAILRHALVRAGLFPIARSAARLLGR